jgi:hypothetical protein
VFALRGGVDSHRCSLDELDFARVNILALDAIVELNGRACSGNAELPCVPELVSPVMQAAGRESVRAAVARAVAGLTAGAATHDPEMAKFAEAYSAPPVLCGFMRRRDKSHLSGQLRCVKTHDQGVIIGQRFMNASAYNWASPRDTAAMQARVDVCWVDCDLLMEGVFWIRAGGLLGCCCSGTVSLLLVRALTLR